MTRRHIGLVWVTLRVKQGRSDIQNASRNCGFKVGCLKHGGRHEHNCVCAQKYQRTVEVNLSEYRNECRKHSFERTGAAREWWTLRRLSQQGTLTRLFQGVIWNETSIWIYFSNMSLSVKPRKFGRTTEFSLGHTAEMLPRSCFWVRDALLWLHSDTQCLALTAFTNKFCALKLSIYSSREGNEHRLCE